MGKILYTPLGEAVDEDDLEELGRVECPECHFAVLEDEARPVDQVCIYCINEAEG